jgi:hypothetical protein
MQEKPQHKGRATQKNYSHNSSMARHMTSITIQIERPDKFFYILISKSKLSFYTYLEFYIKNSNHTFLYIHVYMYL